MQCHWPTESPQTTPVTVPPHWREQGRMRRRSRDELVSDQVVDRMVAAVTTFLRARSIVFAPGTFTGRMDRLTPPTRLSALVRGHCYGRGDWLIGGWEWLEAETAGHEVSGGYRRPRSGNLRRRRAMDGVAETEAARTT